MGMVSTKISQYPFIQPKTNFSRVTVIFPLCNRIIDILIGVLIFEFQSHKRYAVYGEQHIHRQSSVIFGIMPLSYTTTDIAFILYTGCLVEGSFRLEKTDKKAYATMSETVSMLFFYKSLIFIFKIISQFNRFTKFILI